MFRGFDDIFKISKRAIAIKQTEQTDPFQKMKMLFSPNTVKQYVINAQLSTLHMGVVTLDGARSISPVDRGSKMALYGNALSRVSPRPNYSADIGGANI